jgi:hypothetical protein
LEHAQQISEEFRTARSVLAAALMRTATELNDLAYEIIGSAIEVHRRVGPGASSPPTRRASPWNLRDAISISGARRL